MAGNLVITANLGTLSQFQAELMSVKIPDVKSEIQKILQQVITQKQTELIKMAASMITG